MVKIAVVMPTLNEAASITDSLQRIRNEWPHELVVVDGGSSDDTVALAREQGVQVLESTPGRAVQQNRGAAATSSEVLLFLHADCSLEPGSLRFLRAYLEEHPQVSGGCFRMRVTSKSPLFRAIDLAGDVRAALIGIPYGDQGIFTRRKIFETLGGFPELPLMEDVFFSIRLRQEGRIAVVPRRIFVSARRWRKRGIIGQTLLNWSLTIAAAANVPPFRLARFYPVVR